MEVFLVSLLNGLVYGMLLFMLASGLTLIFSMMGVLNFAHASAYMLGAYFAYTISRLIGFWPALLIAPLICGTLGQVVGTQGHFPFGEAWYGTSQISKNQFTSYERDSESGNDFAMARSLTIFTASSSG